MAYSEDIDDLLEFDDREAWRAWLDANHGSVDVAWIRIQKKASTSPGPRYAEAVEEALCYGWVDGKMHGIDDRTFAQRFTPRRPTSVWARSNVKRIERLIAEGRMTPAGMAVVEDAKRRGSWDKAYGGDAPAEPPPELLAALASADAEAAYEALPPGSRTEYARWVDHAKQAETRERRGAEVAKRALLGKRIGEL